MYLFIKPIKRIGILIPGIIIAYFSYTDIYPYIHRRTSIVIAIFITYVLGAYLLIPLLIRLIRTIIPPKHLPMYCVTPDGLASDPLNIALVGSRIQVITAMEEAGWSLADPYSPINAIHHVIYAFLGKEYKSAPVSHLYLFGKRHDIAFEYPADGQRSRHHVRFWLTSYVEENKEISINGIHWKNRVIDKDKDNILWVGAASLDTGLALVRHTMQFTHMVDPDTNKERELIIQDLKKSNAVKKTKTIQLTSPYKLINRAWRIEQARLHSDGKLSVIWLKNVKIKFTN